MEQRLAAQQAPVGVARRGLLMWAAVTAAVIMGGLVWIARIAAAARGERQRAEDVAELAAGVKACASDLESVTMNHGDRLDAIEGKVAAVQSAQALGPGRRR